MSIGLINIGLSVKDIVSVIPFELIIFIGSFIEEIFPPLPSPLIVIITKISTSPNSYSLLYLFFIAIIAVIGGLVGYFLSFSIDRFSTYLLPFTAGGFIYIAASDLMPEIRKETSLKKSMVSFGIFLLGVGIMFLVKLISHE